MDDCSQNQCFGAITITNVKCSIVKSCRSIGLVYFSRSCASKILDLWMDTNYITPQSVCYVENYILSDSFSPYLTILWIRRYLRDCRKPIFDDFSDHNLLILVYAKRPKSAISDFFDSLCINFETTKIQQ
jgi:hypothetical protein